MSSTPPPLPAPGRWTQIQVGSHLHTLKILFYVLGAVELLIAPLLLLAAVAGYISEGKSTDPDAAPLLLLILLGVGGVVYAALGALSISAARRIAARQQHRLCLIAAGLACLAGALGIALGAYGLWALLRPEVAASFLPPDSTVIA
jgi:TRAP-type C4-dicarboxylate transport system permease small subunit